jgi:hypothetical protein
MFNNRYFSSPTLGVMDLRSTTSEGPVMALVLSVGVCQPATVVAGTTCDGAAMASFRLVGVISASHCGGGHDS